MLGCHYAVRRLGGRGLVLDGHSDFSNPANDDFTARLGAVAGMDLPLATGSVPSRISAQSVSPSRARGEQREFEE